MEKSSKTALLLVTTLALWIVHSVMPAIEGFLPILHLSSSIHLPWGQILNQLMGVSVSFSTYSWLHIVLDRKVSLTNNLFYLFCGYLVTTGHGIHTACVVLQKVMSQDNELFDLAHFLHEKVSHNMFMSGFYAMIAAVILAEQNATMEWLKKMKEKGDPNNISCRNSYLYDTFFQWVLPIVIGTYFSIFAWLTETAFVTLIFYICIIIGSLSMYRQLASSGLSLSNIYTLCSAQMLVCGSLAKAAVIGLPVLIASECWL